MKTLVAGWFSFEGMNVTAGDVMARDVACRWLEGIGLSYEVASIPVCGPGVDWRRVRPEDYDQVLFVCGPFRDNLITAEFLQRFHGRRLVGIDLSMLQPLAEWDPFDILIERDSDRACRPDLAFVSAQTLVPVVGLLLVHPQRQYGERAKHRDVRSAIQRSLAKRDIAVVPIDTRLEENPLGLTSAVEIESLIARMDVTVTTRLHGVVLALRNGIPPLAVDPIEGGAKIRLQCEAIGWPMVLTAGAFEDADVDQALDYCLSDGARRLARQVGTRAAEMLQQVRLEFERALAPEQPG